MNDNEILDLELELMSGGWSLETQRTVLENLRGKPKSFRNCVSAELAREADEAFRARQAQNV